MKDFEIQKTDIIIVVVLVILSILPLFIFAKDTFEDQDRFAVIYVDGEKYKEIKLGEGLSEEYEIVNGKRENIVEITGFEVHMEHSNCFDKICVKQGIISGVGESIVCLPNKIFIEIVGKEPPDIDDISR